jgi:hypothetical protein
MSPHTQRLSSRLILRAPLDTLSNFQAHSNIHGVLASSAITAISPTVRYNGRRNLTVHVFCKGHLTPSFALGDGCIMNPFPS